MPRTYTLERLARDDLIEAASLGPETTGFEYPVHVYQVWDRKPVGRPRLRLFQGPRWERPISISIPETHEEEPRVVAGKVTIPTQDLERVFEWVRRNREILLRYWNDAENFYDTMAFIEGLVSVS